MTLLCKIIGCKFWEEGWTGGVGIRGGLEKKSTERCTRCMRPNEKNEEGVLISRVEFGTVNANKIEIEHEITFAKEGGIEGAEIVSIRVDGKIVKFKNKT